jgi:glutamyl-tRNA reductase
MIAVVGLSHRTAPIEVRERLALGDDAVVEVLRALRADAAVAEALVLSTCNRVEVAVAGDDPATAAAAARRVLSERAPHVGPHLYEHVGAPAVTHLFRVAASLDSLVVGEPQILGQLKQAWALARDQSALGARLDRAVTRALHAAKRVRSETALGSGQVSVPSVAVDLVRDVFGELARREVVLIGSGEMAEATARALIHSGARLTVVGRNSERTTTLAQSFGGVARGLAELDQVLVSADVVVSSTSAPHFVVERSRVALLKKQRRGRPLFFIDLAVPRDIEPSVERLDGVFLYNVDDLSQVVASGLDARSREITAAEAIVASESHGFERWSEGEQITPVVRRLRERVTRVLGDELERSLRGRLKHLAPDDREALERMVEASVNKLLHAPTMRLREIARDADAGAGSAELCEELVRMFELQEVDGPTAIEAAPEQGLAQVLVLPSGKVGGR